MVAQLYRQLYITKKTELSLETKQRNIWKETQKMW